MSKIKNKKPATKTREPKVKLKPATKAAPKAEAPKRKRPSGEKHPRAKLSDNDIKAIRKAYKEGVPQAELARHYEVSVTYMHKIVHKQAR